MGSDRGRLLCDGRPVDSIVAEIALIPGASPLAAAVRYLRRGFTPEPDDARPTGQQLRQALTRAPRTLWGLGQFAVQLAPS